MLWDLLWPSVWLERDQERESQRERGSSLNPPVSRYIFLRLSVWEGELIARTVCQCFNSKFWIFLQSSPRTVCIFIGLPLPTTPYGTMLMHHLLNRPQMPWSRRDFATVLQLAQNRHNTGLFFINSWIWQSDCTELELWFATHCCKYFEEEHDALPLACPVTACINSVQLGSSSVFSPGDFPSSFLSIMFTFAAFCYMLSLVLCASLIFFAIWHVSVCIFDVLCENMLQNGMHVLKQRLLHQTELPITRSKPPWYYECLWHVLHHQI